MLKDSIGKFPRVLCSCIVLALTASCGGGGGGGGGGGASTITASTPSVVFTIPSRYQNGVATNSAIAVTFNIPMNAATLNAATFLLDGPTGAVAGTVAYSGRTATFTPSPLTPLTANTTYRATITTGARSQAEIPLAGNVSWKFATGAVADNAGPTVTPDSPEDLDVNIPLNTLVSATFNEPVLASSITTGTFTLKNGLVPVPGSVSFDGAKTATFLPTSPLLPTTVYTAAISGVKDLADNPLGGMLTWTFTTSASSDATPPAAPVTSPVANALNVAVTSTVTATFGEKMNPASLNLLTFTLGSTAGSVPGTIAYDSLAQTATFTPNSQLAGNTVHTATVSTGATDMAGNSLPASFTWSFTTGADFTQPTVISTIPADVAAGVPSGNPTIAATFSEAINPASITNATYTLEQIAPGTFTIGGATFIFDGTTIELVPPGGTLAPTSTYRVTVTTGAQDMAGNPLAANFIWTFTTQ